MSLISVLIIICLALLIGRLTRGPYRAWALFVSSILILYWLQPGTPIRNLDFWLPTSCLALAVIAWILTREHDSPVLKLDWITAIVIAVVVLLIGSTRYLGDMCCLTPSRPPPFLQISFYIVSILVISILLARFTHGRNGWMYGLIVLILLLFIVLKSEPLSKLASMGLRAINHQSLTAASALDIRWLGFSYVAFRLIHTLRDRLSGKLPGLSLQEYITYIIFFPAISAGPIDRLQRFSDNLHQPFQLTTDTLLMGGKRILLGIFSKFVLADGLALFALNSGNADQINSRGWLWIIMYAYAFRIFFDFSGYTDIAIGMGNLIGIQLPENFERPYRKPNLTLFWNSWHMTLANWFRAYFFNPLTRALRSQPRSLPLPLIILIGQLSTFTLIGIWHGITWNYAIWGAWHGLGLFIHNRWSSHIRARSDKLNTSPRLQSLLTVFSVLLTFNYVSLGWIWFALSTPDQSWRIFLQLFGLK